jgi:hypothetical protein
MLDGYSGQEFVLLSYDVRVAARSVAVRVCRIVFGRVRTDRLDAGRPREEKGFIHRPGVVWIGQSVLVLPPNDGKELAGRLQELGVQVSLGPVTISHGILNMFERGSRSPG